MYALAAHNSGFQLSMDMRRVDVSCTPQNTSDAPAWLCSRRLLAFFPMMDDCEQLDERLLITTLAFTLPTCRTCGAAAVRGRKQLCFLKGERSFSHQAAARRELRTPPVLPSSLARGMARFSVAFGVFLAVFVASTVGSELPAGPFSKAVFEVCH